MKGTICFDFDGVIFIGKDGYVNDELRGNLNIDIKEYMEELVNRDYYIVILTARLDPFLNPKGRDINKILSDWLGKEGMENDKHYHIITATKPPALCYIDDKAVFYDRDVFMNDLRETVENFIN